MGAEERGSRWGLRIGCRVEGGHVEGSLMSVPCWLNNSIYGGLKGRRMVFIDL